MSKIAEYFNNDEYSVFFSHGMPISGYELVEDYDEDVSREFFIALFKLFMSSQNECYNNFEGVNFYFDDEFGCYDDDEDYGDFVESLQEEDYALTKKETKLLKKYLTNLISDIADFEEEEYDPDYADSDIEDAIENKSFVIMISSQSLL